MRNFLILTFLIILGFGSASAQDFRWPRIVAPIPGSGGGQTFNIDGTSDSIEYIFTAPEAATITQLQFVYDSKTGTPVAHKIGLQDVSTSTGRASGSFRTGNGECSASFTPPNDSSWNGTSQTVTLTGTTCALTRGEKFAIVLIPTGTPTGANYSTFVHTISGNSGSYGVDEYHFNVNAGTPSSTQTLGAVSWGNGSRWFGNPYYTYGQDYISSDTSPDEIALRFQFPCASGQTFKVAGASAVIKIPATATAFKFVLYNGTTVLQDVTVDADQLVQNGSIAGVNGMFDESSLSDLSCGTTYRLSIQASSTSMNMYIPSGVLNSNAYMDSQPFGKETYYSQRVDAGSWTDTTTKRPSIMPIIDKVNAVSSGGGFLRNLLGGGI